MRVSRRVLCWRRTRASASSSSSCAPPAVGDPGSPASVSMGTEAASSCFHFSRLYSLWSTLRRKERLVSTNGEINPDRFQNPCCNIKTRWLGTKRAMTLNNLLIVHSNLSNGGLLCEKKKITKNLETLYQGMQTAATSLTSQRFSVVLKERLMQHSGKRSGPNYSL